jgi:hypothetical protein
MFPPYYCIETLDETLDETPSPQPSSIDVSLERFIPDFPILDQFVVTNSDSSHYRVLRSMIVKLHSLVNHAKFSKCLEATKLLISFMPTYPRTFVVPMSELYSAFLDDKAPDLFSVIIIRNPALIPPNPHRATVKLGHQLGEILSIQDAQQFDQSLLQFSKSLTPDSAGSGQILFRAFFEYLFTENRATKSTFAVLYRLFELIPEQIFSLKCPESGLALSKIIPYSLIKPIEFYSVQAFEIIKLYRFAFSIVQTFLKSPNLISIIPLHRLTVSGLSAIDSLLFAFHRTPRLLETLSNRELRKETRLAFGSVLASLLTCVELPSLGIFVRATRERLPRFFDLLTRSATSTLLRRSFLRIYSLLACYGDTPMHHLYGKWVMTSTPVLSLRQLEICSPMDPVFIGLIRACATELAVNFPLAVEVVTKSFFNRGCLAMNRAISIIARFLTFDGYVPYVKTILYSPNSLAAIHLLCQMEGQPDFAKESYTGHWIELIRVTLLSESPLSAEHLFFFGKSLSLLQDEQLLKITSILTEDLNGIEKNRIFLRMLMMVTSSSEFVELMKNHPLFQQSFADCMQKYLEEIQEEEVIAAICIAWHNACLGAKGITEVGVIQNFIRKGAEALTAVWGRSENAKMITKAFCEVIVVKELRTIVSEIVSASSIRNAEFIGTLRWLDESLTVEMFPDCEGSEIEGEMKEIEIWGPEIWKESMFGQAVSMFSVIA